MPQPRERVWVVIDLKNANRILGAFDSQDEACRQAEAIVWRRALPGSHDQFGIWVYSPEGEVGKERLMVRPLSREQAEREIEQQGDGGVNDAVFLIIGLTAQPQALEQFDALAAAQHRAAQLLGASHALSAFLDDPGLWLYRPSQREAKPTLALRRLSRAEAADFIQSQGVPDETRRQ